MTIATTMRTTQLFSSAIDEAPAPAQQQEQPVAQEQEQQQEQQQPARRRPSSPKPSGPWVLLEGRQEGRGRIKRREDCEGRGIGGEI